MESRTWKCNVLAYFSSNIWILPYFGTYEQCVSLMWELCRDTREGLIKNKKIYQRVIRKTRWTFMLKGSFTEKHREYLLLNDNYKNLHLCLPMGSLVNGSEEFIKFLKEVPSPRQLSISKLQGTNASWESYAKIRSALFEVDQTDAYKLRKEHQISAYTYGYRNRPIPRFEKDLIDYFKARTTRMEISNPYIYGNALSKPVSHFVVQWRIADTFMQSISKLSNYTEIADKAIELTLNNILETKKGVKLKEVIKSCKKILYNITYLNLNFIEKSGDIFKIAASFLIKEKYVKDQSAVKGYKEFNFQFGIKSLNRDFVVASKDNTYVMYLEKSAFTVVRAKKARFGFNHTYSPEYSDENILVFKEMQFMELEDVKLCNKHEPFSEWAMKHVRDKLDQNMDWKHCYIVENRGFGSITAKKYTKPIPFSPKELWKFSMKAQINNLEENDHDDLVDFISRMPKSTCVEASLNVKPSTIPGDLRKALVKSNLVSLTLLNWECDRFPTYIPKSTKIFLGKCLIKPSLKKINICNKFCLNNMSTADKEELLS